MKIFDRAVRQWGEGGDGGGRAERRENWLEQWGGDGEADGKTAERGEEGEETADTAEEEEGIFPASELADELVGGGKRKRWRKLPGACTVGAGRRRRRGEPKSAARGTPSLLNFLKKTLGWGER